MLAIEIENLEKKYKDLTAVNKINLSINEGELFALLGVNGAGKSTTIKMLSGLTKPTSGDAKLLGKSITTETHEVKEIMNVSPQETAIAPNLTVKENLELIAGIYEVPKNEINSRINKVVEEFKLKSIVNKKSKLLSGGWQRRLSIAMALLSEPKILFLDEPTLGLDVIARRELWDVIESLKGNVTIILTTHYMEEAEMLSDRVGIMKDGNILLIDTPANIVKKTGAKNFEEAFVSVVTGKGK